MRLSDIYVKNVDDCGSWMRSAATGGVMDSEQRLLRTLHTDWLMHSMMDCGLDGS
jgi:hypothetical protein